MLEGCVSRGRVDGSGGVGRAYCGMTRNDWRRVETVWWEEVEMLTRMGFWREARWRDSTFEDMVALKR